MKILIIESKVYVIDIADLRPKKIMYLFSGTTVSGLKLPDWLNLLPYWKGELLNFY